MARRPNGTSGGGPVQGVLPPTWKPWALVFGIFAAVIVLLFVASWARQVWTDLLWFGEVGYRSTYLTILKTKVLLFFVGAGVFALVAGVNVVVAFRLSRGPQIEPIPREVQVLLNRTVIGGAVFVLAMAGLVFASSAAGRWETVLGFANSVRFGTADPQFGRDVGFFVFQLPMLEYIKNWFLAALIVTLLATLAVYGVRTVLRGAVFSLTGPLRVHISLLGAGLLMVFFFSYWLGIYELVFSTRGAVFGATYTDVTARLFAHRVLMAVVVGAAVMLVANAFYFRQTRFIAGVVGLWIGAVVVVGVIYPSLVQRFQVQPSELGRERPYIERNIAATRTAFGLDRINEQTYPLLDGSMTGQVVANNPETVSNIRLWDHRPLRDVYNQIQFIRLYYDFHDVDVDRYTVDGRYRQVMASVRELSPDKLPQDAQRWVNRKLQFTHGYGAVMSPVTDFTPEGRPIFFLKDVPPTGSFPVTQPEVYYGETNANYVIVNSRQPEFDYPTESDVPVYKNYAGDGGVQLSNFFRRMLFAWQFRDVNILISSEVSPESRIMYRRTVQERISTIAPFLRLDRDPYIVVADGRLVWIQDAYTITNRYPYSTPSSGGFNYIRNSVKVVVDAYDGTVTFYVFEPDDPLVQVYQKVFPGQFKPMDAMPAELRAHARYPEDLFTIQAEKYLTYHMTDPTVFFNKEDLWSVPKELYFGASQPMEAYYLIMKLPGEQREEFVLLMPFTPNNRPNLVAWLGARMDAPYYGQLVSFVFPKDRQVDGPEQVEARIDNDPVIRQEIALWSQAGARVLRGNLLVIPMDNRLVYVEPLYLQPANLPFPELTRVIVVDGIRVAMNTSVERAVAQLISGAPSVVTQPRTPTGSGQPASPASGAAQPSGAAQSSGTLQEQLQQASQTVETLQEQLQKLREALQAIQKQLERGAP